MLRMVGQWMGKARKMAAEFQGQFQEAMREAEMADLKKSFDEVKEAATGFTGGNIMTSLQKDVGAALRIDDIDKPAISKTDTPAVSPDGPVVSPAMLQATSNADTPAVSRNQAESEIDLPAHHDNARGADAGDVRRSSRPCRCDRACSNTCPAPARRRSLRIAARTSGLSPWLPRCSGLPGREQIEGLALFRFDAPLFFANTRAFRQQIRTLAER